MDIYSKIVKNEDGTFVIIYESGGYAHPLLILNEHEWAMLKDEIEKSLIHK